MLTLLARRWGWGQLLFASLILAGCEQPKAASPPAAVQPAQPKTLVVIVPGTWDNASFWPNVEPGQVSFGSELARALPPGSEVYPFVWASGNAHDPRAAAADDLVARIEQRRKGFDRVCLVGYSHGGNICLLAAAKLKTPIDMLVCLSTPHVYLKMRDRDKKPLHLPVYCSPDSLKNIRRIVSIWPSTDRVPDVWASLLTGLEESKALQLTAGWQEKNNFPRLIHDGPVDRFFNTGPLTATNRLAVEGVDNLVVHSLVDDSLGVRAHQCIHSRRMGYLIGRLIASGGGAPEMQYLARLVQRSTDDTGEPLAEADCKRETDEEPVREDDKHCGWMLKKIRVQLVDPLPPRLGKLDKNSLPDLFVKMIDASDGSLKIKTKPLKDANTGEWPCAVLIKNGHQHKLEVWDDDVVQSDLVGSVRFDSTDPPKSLSCDAWTAALEWEPVHH